MSYFDLFLTCWVFTAARRLSLIVVSRGYSLQQLPLWGAQALGPWASAVEVHRPSSCSSWAPEHRLSSVAHELSCSMTCGIFLGQGSHPCPLHW